MDVNNVNKFPTCFDDLRHRTLYMLLAIAAQRHLCHVYGERIRKEKTFKKVC